MTRPPDDREALIAALAEEARSRAGETPEPEELLDYLAGRLAPEDEERLGRELPASPEATRALLDLADFEAAGAAAGSRPPEVAVQAGWRELQGRLPDARRPWPRRLPALLSAAAAGLLVTTVGLGTWVWRLQSELDRPIANLPSLELLAVTRAGREPAAELPAGARLRLVLFPQERCPGYEAELEGPKSGDRLTIEGLERDEMGRLTPLLRLEPGSYRLRLYGCEPRRELEEHRFRILGDGG